ncbi:membrane-bound alkaline phosphatase [Pieris rapae]|uniref:membrane-bound alkaline phosphatase n=1 Tax=Pieris rapae TaxID=64459 RepID=UPI001E27E814|nr:membrane-bound alkaline phosphatase [Pieris rapae]
MNTTFAMLPTRLCLLLCCLLVRARSDRYHAAAPEHGVPAYAAEVAGEAENTADYWAAEARAGIEDRMHQGYSGDTRAARNVIMFLGDGMSVPTITAARTLLGQRAGRTGEEAQLSFEKFPTVGLSKTYCTDAQIADSACSATAYLCGTKANEGTLGVTGAVRRRDCAASQVPSSRLTSIAAWALADGRDAGIVTTARVTHASPAGAYARSANRDWESDTDVTMDNVDSTQCPDIAAQLVNEEPGKLFKIILGGGRREFLPSSVVDEEGTRGRRSDNRNLIEEWQADKRSRNETFRYVWNREQLLEAREHGPEYLLGLFEGSHMQYHMEADNRTEPTLAELTETAIRLLSRNQRGFFLFVESGRIDHAHHENQPELALDETLALSAAVQRATELLSAERDLLVVTADHAHVMAFNGYSARGNDVLGPSGTRDADGVRYMTLSYANGPGHRAYGTRPRSDVTLEQNYRSTRWMSHVDVPLSSETHGGDDVGVFARGPQHGLFGGVYEQSRLPHLMAYATCLGPEPHACSRAITNAASAALLTCAALLLASCRGAN